MCADLSADVDIKNLLGAFFIADVVESELKETGTPLPRTSPARARLGLDFRYKGLSVRPEAVFTGPRRADDVVTLETPTAGYSLFNVNASYTIASD